MTNEMIRTDVQTINIEPSQVLSSTSREGDFVHQNQTMATGEDFRNVSKLWYDKTISFEQGREKMALERQEREDIEFRADAVEFSADANGVIITIDERDFRPTPFALAKLCTWFHAPQTVATYYLNAPNNGKYKRDVNDFECIAFCLENGVRRLPAGKELMFRTYQDGTLRSVMSDSYSIVDNDWYLNLLSALIPGGRLSHWRGDADTIYGNVLIPDSIRAEIDSEYGGMLSLSNCEIGRRVIAQIPSIFRAICMNGCIWGQTKGIMFKQRHKGINLDDLAEQIKANIQKQIPLLSSHIDVQLLTRQWKLQTKAVNVFAAFQQIAKVSAAIAEDCAAEWLQQGKDSTAFGVIDAITRVSQLQDPAIGDSMDVYAGMLLTRKNWDFLEHTAKGLDEKTVLKNLNQAV